MGHGIPILQGSRWQHAARSGFPGSSLPWVGHSRRPAKSYWPVPGELWHVEMRPPVCIHAHDENRATQEETERIDHADKW